MFAARGILSSGYNPIEATGGDEIYEITINGAPWRVHKFTKIGTSSFNVLDSGYDGYLEYFLVGGGGGGGSSVVERFSAGGGGGGGIVQGSLNIQTANYSIVVGAGGSGSLVGGRNGNNGENSSLNNIIAFGGGGGGSLSFNSGTRPSDVGSSNVFLNNGLPGGSGGGSRGIGTVGGVGISGQGFNGGSCFIREAGAGGGGAGGPGQNATITNIGGNGGPGALNSFTGTNTYYSGGGAGTGGAVNGNGGIGGGGGANQTGAPNTGGGGGGFVAPYPAFPSWWRSIWLFDFYGFREFPYGRRWPYPSRPGPSGGSGIAVIRYPLTN